MYSDTIWIPTVYVVCQGGFMAVCGHLEQRLGVRRTVTLGCVLMTTGVLLTYFTIQVTRDAL